MPYRKVDKLIEDNGFNETCRHCGFYKEWTESHPYGDGTASEDLAECLCFDDTQCPRLQDLEDED